MTESNIAVTAGSGEVVDTFTLAGGNKRQAVVIGDSSIGANVAPVQSTDPTSATQGVVVRDVNTSAIAAQLSSGITVSGITNSVNVYLGATAGTINVALKPGTIAISLDPGHELGSIKGINSTVGFYLDSTAGTINVQLKPGTIAVQLDPGHLLGAVTANAGTGTMTVVFDPGHELGSIKGTNSSLAVFLDPGHLLGSVTANAGTGTMTVAFDPGHELGTIKGNSNTLTVFLPDTGHTIGKVDAGSGTFNVQFDPGHTLGAITSVGSITNTVNVQFDPGHTLGNIGTLNSITNTVAVFFSPANPAVNATFTATSLEVVPTTGSRKITDDSYAAQRVLIVGSQTNASLSVGVGFTAGDGASPNGFQFGTATQGYATIINYGFNGSTYDRMRTNSGVASAAQRVVHATDVATSVNIVSQASTLNVQLDPGHTIGNIGTINSITGSVAVYFDRGNPTVNATFSSTSMEVVPTTGSRKITDDASASMRVLIAGTQTNASLTINGSLTGITNSIQVHLLSTGGTINVQLKPGTIAVSLDPGFTLGKVDQGVASTTQAWLVNSQGTASVFTASGTANGVSVSGNTIISPSANASFKIYAFSVQTTGQVSLTTKFTNGAGTSPTEYFRPLITASGVTGAQGANLATQPGNPLFVTGTSTTLSLVLDSATLVHYSVAYTKESA